MATSPIVSAQLNADAGAGATLACDQLVDLFWFYGAPSACVIANSCQSLSHGENINLIRASVQELPASHDPTCGANNVVNLKAFDCGGNLQASINIAEHPNGGKQPAHGVRQQCANINAASQQCARTSTKWLRQVFDTFDENKDGLLSLNELRRSFEKLGFESSNVHCLLHYSLADSNCSSVSNDRKGHVSQDDFLLLYHGISCKQCGLHHDSSDDQTESKNCNGDDVEEDLLWDAFNVFDKDKDGFISPTELQSVLCSLGFGAARELDACIEMIRGYDRDGDGQVDFEEFKDMLNSAIKHS